MGDGRARRATAERARAGCSQAASLARRGSRDNFGGGLFSPKAKASSFRQCRAMTTPRWYRLKPARANFIQRTILSTWTSSSQCCMARSAKTAPSRVCWSWRTSPTWAAAAPGSAAGMDKDVMKRLFRDAGIPIVPHVTLLRSSAWRSEPKKVRQQIESVLKYPVFVKPANLGSSVGISKVHDASELAAAMDDAARYDRKLLVEQGVGGKNGKAREIECSVLGNDHPIASVPGEVVPVKEFYDYNAKYLEEGSKLIIPAKLPKSKENEVRRLAIAAVPIGRLRRSAPGGPPWTQRTRRCMSTKSTRFPASRPSACTPSCGRRAASPTPI